jgi:hypothetical protein
MPLSTISAASASSISNQQLSDAKVEPLRVMSETCQNLLRLSYESVYRIQFMNFVVVEFNYPLP